MSEKALDGVKVVEYCSSISGPYCTKLLADLGAEVIKIEPPVLGDEARMKGPFYHDIPDPNLSGLFLYLNTNKLGITLNFNSITGRDIFKQLIANADIFVEDKLPGNMKGLGLGYDILKEINPRLIMTSITPFGQTGPYRNYKAYYLNTFNAGGQGYLVRSRDREQHPGPVKLGGYLGEYDAGLSASVATLGALYWQGINHLGQWLDISKQEAVVALERVVLGLYPNDGVQPPTMSQEVSRRMVGLIMCKDGYVVLVMPEERQWTSLVELMGNPEWAKDEKYKDQFSRAQYADEIDPYISEWMMVHTKDEIYRRGQALGVPIAPVKTAQDIVESEQLEERGFFHEIDHAIAGRIKYPGAPYIFSRTPLKLERPAPLLGEHNEFIYCDRLGYNTQELAEMTRSGVL
ncbi:CaiB/BaiF CoA transferase family protein [Chloroflexota bacterium]